MNISLPEELKDFVDQQVGSRGYTSSSEYVRELIRREQDREKLRSLLMQGVESPLSDIVADEAYFDSLKAKARDWATTAQSGRKGVERRHGGTKTRKG